MCNSQERNRAFPAPSEARLLREAGHEGHPHRPAHDLHAPPHVHRDLHEEVSVRASPLGGPSHTHPVRSSARGAAAGADRRRDPERHCDQPAGRGTRKGIPRIYHSVLIES